MVLTLLDNGKKHKRPKDSPEIPDNLSAEEQKYFYNNPQGQRIFTPIYEIYNETYLRSIVGSIPIETAYTHFADTSWMEKYTTNLYQFSAAKSVDKARKMQREVYDPNGKLRSFSEFKHYAGEIQKIENVIWLRVERDNCTRQAIMADKFNDFRSDAESYPYWIYVGRMDSRERPEHKALEGLIFRIGDRYGDMMFPPTDWNCRCSGKQIDDMFLRRHNRKVQTDQQAKGWLTGVDEKGKPFVDEQFRYNPADQGMLPKVGKYFVSLPNANQADAQLFGIGGPNRPSLHEAHILPHLPSILNDWKSSYHVDRLGNIVFQNYELLSNVWLTGHSVNKIHAHPRGVDMLPETVSDPSEVWARWEDTADQQVVLRNYITYKEKNAYVVQTRAGAIQDAFLISRNQSENHRIGVPWIK